MVTHPPPAARRRHRPRRAASALPSPSCLLALLLCACASRLLSAVPSATAYASWFTDRRLSCMTDLAPGEIVMNAAVLPHSESREPSIELDVFPLGTEDDGAPGSEYVVRFVVPNEVRGRVPDVQCVLDLGPPEGGAGGEGKPPAATFTSAPPDGGIGCDGRRSHARIKGKSNPAAVVTIDEKAKAGTRVVIGGGWAAGHEAVTLTEKVVLVVGKGVVALGDGGGGGGGAGGGGAAEDTEYDDDALQDDEAEAELEESFIEEEREDLENEIQEAEEDAVEALEEKRVETEGLGKEINEAEEEIFAALEDNRAKANGAMDRLKAEIEAEKAKRQNEKDEKRAKDEFMAKHMHNMKERMEAQRKHREAHDRKRDEGKLEEMHRRFARDSYEARKDKLDELMAAKQNIQDSIGRLKKADNKEHERARREHIKRMPKEELKLDMAELKKKYTEGIKKTIDRLGVNELMNEPHMKEMRKHLKKGYVRGSVYEGDKGEPLPPEGRHFLFVMFTLFGLVGFVRWFFDKRRRARKGRRKL